MRVRGAGYQLSQRCRKLIEELFGEGKATIGSRDTTAMPMVVSEKWDQPELYFTV
jgi:hypothetical protein